MTAYKRALKCTIDWRPKLTDRLGLSEDPSENIPFAETVGGGCLNQYRLHKRELSQAYIINGLAYLIEWKTLKQPDVLVFRAVLPHTPYSRYASHTF